MPVDGLVEVPGLVDLPHKLGDDGAALLALVVRVSAHDAPALVVHALDLGNEPGVVVLDLDLGVDAQEQGSRGLGDGSLPRAARRLVGGGGRSASGENCRKGGAHRGGGEDALQARGLHGVLLGCREASSLPCSERLRGHRLKTGVREKIFFGSLPGEKNVRSD